MGLSRTKLKKELLEKNFEEADNQGGGRKDDPRILPYYDLKEGEKLRVLFRPDADGNIFRHFKKHGPQLRLPGAGTIDCPYHTSGINCPACMHGFDVMNTDKEDGKRWMAKDYYVAQCVVVEAPFELPVRPDDHPERDNEMWVVYLPYKVFKKIKEDFREGLIDDPFEEVFVFKKTENKGGQASYENSFFERNKPEAIEEIFEAFKDSVVEVIDIDDGNIVPTPATEDDVNEWLEKAKELDAKASSKKEGESKEGTSLKDRVGDRLSKGRQSDDNGDKQDATATATDQEADNQESKPSPRERLGGGLKDRLKNRTKA